MELSIQEMVKKLPVHQIPPKYVVNQEPAISVCSKLHQPALAIPVLDMKSLLNDDTKLDNINELHKTCSEWGIFQLVNHGVDTSVVEKLKNEIEEFYKLPSEERLKYKIRPGDFEGYGQTVLHTTNDKIDWADRFYMITNPTERRKPHLFPALPSSLRETLEKYIFELQMLSRALFGLIAETLNTDKTEILEMFEDGMQSMRLNYYPPCPEPNKVIGLTPHSDADGITILWQVNGVEGLQIKRDGVWIPVNILPDAFVINLGDVFEILSNGLYKSIEHRAVVNSEKERITLGMFFNPKFEAQVGPLTSLLSDQEPPLFRRMKSEDYVKDFFSRRLNGKTFLDYMKLQQCTA